MNDLIQNSVFFGVAVSLAAYEIGQWVRKRTKLAICNPLLVAILLVIAFLLAAHIDYETYNSGAKYLSYFLTPATVSLAVPLYEQIKPLQRNWRAILAGVLSGALTSALCVLALSALFGLTHEQYVTLLPKSITTAIGMSVSEELGGMVTVTVAVIVLTGVFGNLIAEPVLRLFGVTEPVAKGIGIGSAAHAVGTARAMELGEVEGAMSSLSIAVSGLLTVALSVFFSSLY